MDSVKSCVSDKQYRWKNKWVTAAVYQQRIKQSWNAQKRKAEDSQPEDDSSGKGTNCKKYCQHFNTAARYNFCPNQKQDDILMEMEAKKQDAEIKRANEIDNSSLMESGKIDRNNFIFVSINTENDEDIHNTLDVGIDIKEEAIENVNSIEDPLIDCKREIDIEEHPLEKLKDEPMSDVEPPQDGSTSVHVNDELNLNTENSNVKVEGCTVFNENMSQNDTLNEDTVRRYHKCEICEKIFATKLYLDVHMNTHSGKRIYGCKICMKKYKLPMSLALHMQTHTEKASNSSGTVEAKNVTEILNRFKSKMDYNENTTQNYILPKGKVSNYHKCVICKRIFATRHFLDEHMNTHTIKSTYECIVCKKTFESLESTALHLQKHIEKDSKTSCSSKKNVYATEISKNGTTILNYIFPKDISSKYHKCEICYKIFATKHFLDAHLRTHND